MESIYNQDAKFANIDGQIYLVTNNEYINAKTMQAKPRTISNINVDYFNEIDGEQVSARFDPFEMPCTYSYGESSETFDHCTGVVMHSPTEGLFQIDEDFYEVNLKDSTKTKINIHNKNLSGVHTAKIIHPKTSK